MSSVISPCLRLPPYVNMAFILPRVEHGGVSTCLAPSWLGKGFIIVEKLMKRILFTLCLMLLAGQASAYYTWGMGSQTCNLYVTAKAEFDHARDQRTHLAHLNWIKGFVTGINWSRDSDIARDLSIDTVDQWIDSYCRKNLGDSIAKASAEMVIDLEKQGKKKQQ